jgi:hypothetical protein
MEKLSGLVLDIYDDPAGEVLKSVFPRGCLPDDAFALILEQDGMELKKFATIDPGNTALSVEYFMKTGHKLPAEAQKVAAHNLCCACEWHGIEPPEELQKIAVSPEWVARKVTSGVSKASPERVAKFQERMRGLADVAGGKFQKIVGGASPGEGAQAVLRALPAHRRASKAMEGRLQAAFAQTDKALGKLSSAVTVSRVPKVRERQLEALKSRGIEGPTKTASVGSALRGGIHQWVFLLPRRYRTRRPSRRTPCFRSA